MSEKEEVITEDLGKKRSIWKIISYNLIGFGSYTAFYSIQSFAFYFWEVEVGLAILFVTLATVLYGLWDAINDPIIGFISDKPRKYTKKWGRRFPWIVFGYFPASIFALFVFLPPATDNTIILFLWFTIFLLLYELFATTGQINHEALYPQLFRTDDERLYASTTNNIIYYLSIFFGLVVPPLFFVYGEPSTFFIGALIIFLMSIPLLLLGIPGNREDERMIQQVLECEETRQKKGYIDTLKGFFKNKNFIATIIYYIAIRTIPALGFGSILYFVRYNLGLAPGFAGLVNLGFLIGGILGIAPWPFVAKKIGFFKTMVITVLGLSFSMFALMFIPDFMTLMITVIFAGFFVSGIEISDTPLAAYMIDEVVADQECRPEGVFYGIRNIIVRISTPITAVAFGLTHFLTGFDPASDTQTPLALFGIRLHFGLIPFIIGIIGIAVFVLLWDLKPHKMEKIWKKIDEKDL